MPTAAYVGRYAPSPTGRLHDGNLRSAALAWAHARSQNGTFLLRMEDLDTPRVVQGSADSIPRDLEALGLDWDGPIVFQSQRLPTYMHQLNQWEKAGLAYPCKCSRRDIQKAATAPNGPEGPIYPGTCKGTTKQVLTEGLEPGRQLSYRLALPPELCEQQVFDERLGAYNEDLSQTVGDFILRRADGIIAYQLACVLDDIRQGITHIVRGEDLISSVARQQLLWKLLGKLPPKWCHLPLSKDNDGQKLSKRLRKWDDTPLNGRKKLGQYAKELAWIPDEKSMTSKDFLVLYQANNLSDPTRIKLP